MRMIQMRNSSPHFQQIESSDTGCNKVTISQQISPMHQTELALQSLAKIICSLKSYMLWISEQR